MVAAALDDKTLPYISTRNSAQKRLQTAILAGDGPSVAAAIAEGASVGYQMVEGTAAHLAVGSINATVKILSLLRHAGADLNALNRDGNNLLALIPICQATQDLKLARAIYLIKHGVKLNTSNPRGLTPLHYAARYQDANLITLYLLRHANAKTTDNKDRTALHWLVNYVVTLGPVQRRCVEKLVLAGADMNKPDQDGHVVTEQLHHLTGDAAWFKKLRALEATQQPPTLATMELDLVV